MISNFKGKTAVLTGAGSGFGLECARIGAKLGMNLVLVDVQQDALDRGLGVVRKNYDASAAKGRFKPEQVDAMMGLITPSLSLDALADRVFKRMNDVDFPVAKVLEGIEAAQAAGISNIKVNMVVQRGVNDHEVLPMARFFQGTGVTLRFIEFMDVGSTNGWNLDAVLPSAELVRRLSEHMPLVRLKGSSSGETAQRWGYAGADGQHERSLGEIGVIGSVTQAFFGDCSLIVHLIMSLSKLVKAKSSPPT